VREKKGLEHVTFLTLKEESSCNQKVTQQFVVILKAASSAATSFLPKNTRLVYKCTEYNWTRHGTEHTQKQPLKTKGIGTLIVWYASGKNETTTKLNCSL